MQEHAITLTPGAVVSVHKADGQQAEEGAKAHNEPCGGEQVLKMVKEIHKHVTALCRISGGSTEHSSLFGLTIASTLHT